MTNYPRPARPRLSDDERNEISELQTWGSARALRWDRALIATAESLHSAKISASTGDLSDPLFHANKYLYAWVRSSYDELERVTRISCRPQPLSCLDRFRLRNPFGIRNPILGNAFYEIQVRFLSGVRWNISRSWSPWQGKTCVPIPHIPLAAGSRSKFDIQMGISLGVGVLTWSSMSWRVWPGQLLVWPCNLEDKTYDTRAIILNNSHISETW